jgi:hypothetical protein
MGPDCWHRADVDVSSYADDVIVADSAGSGVRDAGAAISMLGRTGSNTPTTIGAKFRLGGSGAIGKRDNPTPRHRAWRLASRFFLSDEIAECC